MAYNRSVFPEDFDQFKKPVDLPPSMLAKAQEYKNLQMQLFKTPQEIEKFNGLKVELQNYIINPEFLNHLTDAMTGVQIFFREETVGFIDDLQKQSKLYIDQKLIEVDGTVAEFNTHVANEKAIITTYVDGKKVEMNLYADNKLNQVQLTVTEAIGTMEDKKNHFITLVGTKEAEIQTMVQEFDSRTARYHQKWSAQDGQTNFNIFIGDILDIPVEAKLILAPKDIDVIIQGTRLTPKTDYDILNNGLYDTIQLKGNASSMITAGTEVSALWYKNVGKLYFKHAATHELGGSDEIKNIQEPQLNVDLKNKINSGNLTISTIKPTSGMWYKVVG